MKFTVLLASTFAAMALAMPTAQAANETISVLDEATLATLKLHPARLEVEVEGEAKAAAVGATVCTDHSGGGICGTVQVNTFYSIPYGDTFHDSISSIFPVSGVACQIWDNADGTGQSYSPIVHPGIWNLADYGMNDKVSSLTCWYN